MNADIGGEAQQQRSARLPEFMLLLVTLVWGATFLVIQIALQDGGPFSLLLARFSIGAAVLALALGRRMKALTRDEIWTGAVIGSAAFGTFACQTIGLQYILSSKSAFLTALYVPIVPLLQLAVLGVAPRLSAWLGIVISFLGLTVLSWGEGIGLVLGLGEWITLAGAVLAAVQIILVSKWAPQADPLRLAVVQLGTIAALSLVALPLSGEELPAATVTFWAAAAALGIFGSAFAIGAMNWAQQTVTATRATIIYAMEPVWAGVFGAMAGEAMTRGTLIGSAMIVGGILVSELKFGRRREQLSFAEPEHAEGGGRYIVATGDAD